MAYTIQCYRIKKEKFPAMQEQYRYVMEGVHEECIDISIPMLAEIDLTLDDVDMVWDVRDKLFDVIDPEAVIENNEVLAAIQSIYEAQPMIDLREERDRLIALTDWTQLPDVPEATKLLWQEYRQALRDITETYSSLEEVVWPDKPL